MCAKCSKSHLRNSNLFKVAIKMLKNVVKCLITAGEPQNQVVFTNS